MDARQYRSCRSARRAFPTGTRSERTRRTGPRPKCCAGGAERREGNGRSESQRPQVLHCYRQALITRRGYLKVISAVPVDLAA